METRWQDIFVNLKNDGFEVYPPAMKVGECESRYLVIKDNGSNPHSSFSTEVQLYTVLCYVPKDEYSQLESFVNEVKESMKKLFPMVRPTGAQTPSFYEDSIKAQMISIDYKNYKKV